MGKSKISYYSLLISLLITPFCSQAQCLSGNCYAFADASAIEICEGQSITLTSDGGSAALYNNFNGQTIGTGWLTNNISVMFSNPCGAYGIDGTPYLWFGNTSGAADRAIITADFNMSGGGTISFDLRFSIQGQASPCEGPDLPTEGVYLQYSTNYGASWTTIFYFDPNINNVSGGASSPYVQWDTYTFAIPTPAQTPCTRFRWYQAVVSGAGNDHWGLDNIFIGGPPPNPGSVTFKWLDGPAAGTPRVVTPSDDTQYILMYGNSNDTCYDTVNVIVHDIPVADLSVNPMQACLGSPIQFDASGTDAGTTPILDYKWVFNNSWVINQTTTTPTTSFTFPITGTFNTSVIVTAGICRDTATVPVVVSVPPNVNFTFPSQVCENNTITLDASATTIPTPGVIASYSWDFGNDGTIDLTSSQPMAGIPSPTPGTLPVKLTVTSNAGCAASVVNSINVMKVPEAAFSNNDACIGGVTNFTNESQGTVTQWLWDFSGLSTSIQENPSYTFPGAGIYTVGLIANNGNVCYDTAVATLEIKNTVIANFSFNDPCSLEGVFQDLSLVPPTSEGAINSWSWNFGNGSTSTSQNPLNTYTSNGQYNVTLIVGTDKGCSDTIIQNVPRYARPVADFSADNVCFGQVTNLVNNSSVESGIIANAFWTFGDGETSNEYSPSYSYDAPGLYPVALYVETENGCRDTATKTYQVYPQPVADFEATPGYTDMLSPDVQFTDLSQNAESWAWTFGMYGSSSDKNPLYTFTASGSYNITLVVSNQYGCKNSITYPYEVLPAYNFYIPTSFTPFNGDELNQYFRVYHTGVQEMYFRIFNSWGEELLYTQDPNFLWDGTYLGKKLPQGTYVYKAWVRNVEGKQFQYTGQFVMIY